MGHLQFAIIDGETHPALDQVNRIPPEFLITPTLKKRDVFALTGDDPVEMETPK